MPSWKATERLYLNREKNQVLYEGDPNVVSLLCAVGSTVSEAVCRKYGLGPHALPGRDETARPVEPSSDGDTDSVTPVADPTTDLEDTEPPDPQQTASDDDPDQDGNFPVEQDSSMPSPDESAGEEIDPPEARAPQPPAQSDMPRRRR